MARSLVPWAVIAAVLAVAGIVVSAVGGGALDVAGLALIGAAAVVGVSCAFYAVGRSEDRARGPQGPGPPSSQ
jgi:hypothetical protein